MMESVLQDWVMNLPFMQQSVLLANVRGPDGISKYHPCKGLIRFYRRSVLRSALDGGLVINDPFFLGGGNFTGPSIAETEQSRGDWEGAMESIVDVFVKSRDELPLHYFTHFIDAVQVVGYKHENLRVRQFWQSVYVRLVRGMNAYPESMESMDQRLSDNREQWQSRSDKHV